MNTHLSTLSLSDAPIALCCNHVESAAWQQGLRDLLPQAQVRAWPEATPEAECAIVWSPSQEFMDAHPRLKLIFNMGAGVDALLKLRLPTDALIVRIEDGGMAVQMADYACHALLRHFREFDAYAASAAGGQWQPRAPRSRSQFPVGVMGLGALGMRVAKTIAAFDFPVVGWSQSPKTIEGVQCYAGQEQFHDFLAATRVLVCLLPLTPSTRGIMCHDTLSRLQPGGYVINMARGAHLVEPDLLALLDSGHLSGAALDVTSEEPLPADHAFWQRKEIVLSPHIAAQTVVRDSIEQIAAKIQALANGQTISGVVDPRAGY